MKIINGSIKVGDKTCEANQIVFDKIETEESEIEINGKIYSAKKVKGE